MDRKRFRVGDWVFDPATGDLLEGGPGRRLEPRPAKVLAMLADSAGELVTREQLRDRLWGDTSVDFDQGLDYCIRHILSALGDDAAEPHYIETLPQRGYRLIAGVERLAPAPPPVPDRSGRRMAISLAFVLGAITIFWFGPAGRVADRRAEQDRAREEAVNKLASPAGRAAGVVLAERPLRVAVVALEAPGDAELTERLQRLLDGLVIDFTAVDATQLGVVGPVTSGDFVDSTRPQTEIGAGLGVDYMLSARLRAGEDGAFIQLIRIPDGDPLFATRFPADTDIDAIRNTVAAGALTAIEQDSERALR